MIKVGRVGVFLVDDTRRRIDGVEELDRRGMSNGEAPIAVKRTAATAPLSLASVKVSSTSELLVEFASQETRAIQGVIAGGGYGKQGSSERSDGERTGAVCEVILSEMYECALRIHISDGGTLGGAATHPADTITPCPHQLVGDVGAIRAVPPAQSKVDPKLRIPAHGQELQRWGETHPLSDHNKLSVETSVTFSPLWIALCVSFVGLAGTYARTTAENHRTWNKAMGRNLEERGTMVVWTETGQPSSGLSVLDTLVARFQVEAGAMGVWRRIRRPGSRG